MNKVRYDWPRFDADMKHKARSLKCTDLVRAHGLGRPGRQFSILCPCPDHDDSSPSCSIKEETWKCFGCGAGGDVLDLIGVLDELGSYDAQVRRALAYQGIDYDEERRAFLAASRSTGEVRLQTSTTKASSKTPRVSSRPKPSRHPEDADIVMSVLSRLELDATALEYLEGRGISGELARAHGLVSATYEEWSRAIERARVCYGAHAVERAGLIGVRGGAHPFVKHMLVIPYMGPEAPVGVRIRRLSHDETYGGAKYLGRRHGHNRVTTPYLGSASGWPQGVMPRRGLLWVVEGEFDALSLRACGRASLGVPGALTLDPQWVGSWSRAGGVVLLLDVGRDGVTASKELAHMVRSACIKIHGETWTETNLHVREVSGAKDANELLAEGALCALVREIEAELSA